jgi:hypothetical protein
MCGLLLRNVPEITWRCSRGTVEIVLPDDAQAIVWCCLKGCHEGWEEGEKGC